MDYRSHDFHGIAIFPAARHMPIRKRYQAIVLGRDFYLHRKTYKRLVQLSRRGKDLRPILEKVRVSYRVPKLNDLFRVTE